MTAQARLLAGLYLVKLGMLVVFIMTLQPMVEKILPIDLV
jgi:hypothetical protein